ncbi:MAG: class I SAM-dependent methyltransferase [Rhodocyclaceae bacterium]|nr:class I SAM-dependent methyltransferase [Rhodocyclaceae bacterium]MBX3667276.1 class I SAM-dependent methyltransferase [Rhodocyclaceae bacterium]
MRTDARREARKQWNKTACGELAGEADSIEYFDRVRAARYAQSPWVHEYFRYAEFGGCDVLEIGVGQGSDLLQFAEAGARCHGVDITDKHLALTQRNFALRGRAVYLANADATALPFADSSFDCVYSFGVLHHIPEIELVLAEAYRVLRPGGVLKVALYHKWSAFHIFSKILANGLRNGWLFSKGYAGLLATIEHGADGIAIKPYVKLYGRHEVARLMQAFEVEDISVHQLSADHFWPAFIARGMARWVPRLDSRLGWYVACTARRS